MITLGIFHTAQFKTSFLMMYRCRLLTDCSRFSNRLKHTECISVNEVSFQSLYYVELKKYKSKFCKFIPSLWCLAASVSIYYLEVPYLFVELLPL